MAATRSSSSSSSSRRTIKGTEPADDEDTQKDTQKSSQKDDRKEARDRDAQADQNVEDAEAREDREKRLEAQEEGKGEAKEDKVTESSGDSKDVFERVRLDGKRQIHVDDTVIPFLPEGSPRIGHFAVVTDGDEEHEGKYGVIENAVAFDSKGWPTKVIFRTRDAASEAFEVDYENLREAEAGRR